MKILTYIKSHVVLSTGIAIIAVITTIIAGRVASRANVLPANQLNIRKVTLADVSVFQNNASKISADGIVESISQVDLKSQISAPLASLNVSIGDTVTTGQTIATLQNADVRAQLDQARAGLQAAQGQYTGSGISLTSARRGALEAIRSSYVTTDEIVNIQISQFLYENSGGNPSLASLITDRKLIESIQDAFLTFKNSSDSWKKYIDSFGTASTDTQIEEGLVLSQKKLKDLSMFLDDISEAINEAIKGAPASSGYSALTSWQGIITGARATTDASSKNLITIETALSNAKVSSGSPAEAQISSAQATVRNLEAQLAKTIITAPISGKIAALPLRSGELAQPGQLIVTIVGGGGLQIKAYASGEDITRIKTSAKALIQNTIPGIVVNVSPSVNPINKKVEIKISVDQGAQNTLVIGQNVPVLIDSNVTESSTIQSNTYLLPIQNVKIVPGNAYVFTLDADSKIVKNPVILGKIQGDFVEITSGISSGMKIVSPVYELEEGEKVTVQ